MGLIAQGKALFGSSISKLMGNLLKKVNLPGFGGKTIGIGGYSGPRAQAAKYSPQYADRTIHDEYMFQSHQYPQGVGNADEGHYMAFMVIERKQANFKNTKFRTTISNPDLIEGQNMTHHGRIAKIVKGQNWDDKDIFVPRGVQSGFRNKAYDEKEFLTNMIFLYTPSGIATNYGVEYSPAAAGVFGLLKGGGEEMIKSVGAEASAFAADFKAKGIIGAVKQMSFADTLQTAGDVSGTAVRGIIEGIVGEGMKAMSQASLNTMVNPHMELLMEQPNFRSFNFSYTFAPRNQKELESVHKIIKVFKYHALPSIRGLGTTEHLLDLPSQFEIRYMFMHKENAYLPKISRCFCNAVEVNYTPNEKFTTFKGDGQGASPNIIKMDLKFIEMEIMTKDTIALGY